MIEPFALDIRSDETNDVAKDGFVLSGIEWDRLRVLDVERNHSKLWEYWVECPKCVNGFDGHGNAVCVCVQGNWPGHEIRQGHQKQLWRPDEGSAECRRCKAKAGQPCDPKPFGKTEFHPERVHRAMAAAATANRKAYEVKKRSAAQPPKTVVIDSLSVDPQNPKPTPLAIDPQNPVSVPCAVCLAVAWEPCHSADPGGMHQARKVRLQHELDKQKDEERSDSDKKLEAILQGLGVTNVADATKRIQDIALNSTSQTPQQGQPPAEPQPTQEDIRQQRIRDLTEKYNE